MKTSALSIPGTLPRVALLLGAMLANTAAWAQASPTPSAHDPAAHAHATASTPVEGQELSQGEVVRWDPRTRKVTLRHGPIKNLDMPGMTMVFSVLDTVPVDRLQPGATLRFRAEQRQGAYVVTLIDATP